MRKKACITGRISQQTARMRRLNVKRKQNSRKQKGVFEMGIDLSGVLGDVFTTLIDTIVASLTELLTGLLGDLFAGIGLG
jgi:hypothetical protein